MSANEWADASFSEVLCISFSETAVGDGLLKRHLSGMSATSPACVFPLTACQTK